MKTCRERGRSGDRTQNRPTWSRKPAIARYPSTRASDRLREQLGLSSGGASLVIDRLEQAGHIRRARDHPSDNRVVHLRYTDQGKATGLAFFGSLGERAHAILDGFTSGELQVIARFITAMADSAREHVQELEGRSPGS